MIPAIAIAVFSGGALGASFIEPKLGAFAFVAYALLLPIVFSSSYLRAYCYALVMGLAAFASANYWVYFFLSNLVSSNSKVIALFCFYLIYCANIFGLLILGGKFFYHRLPRWLYLLLVPMYACCLFYYYHLIFQFNLGVTQIGLPDILQPVSLLSHWSLSAFVVLVNLLFAEVLQINPRTNLKNFTIYLSLIIVLSASWLSLAYVSRMIVADRSSAKKYLKLGFHQPVDKSHLQSAPAELGVLRSYTKEIANSYVMANAGASMVVWPESQPKDVLKKAWVLDAYKRHAQLMSADFMLQELTLVKSKPELYRNSSIFIDSSGKHLVHDKMIRIPFGEYMPKVLDQGGLGEWMRQFFSGVHKEVLPGKGAVLFNHRGVKILPQICYELLDDKHLISSIKANPEVQLIIAQSNDNWFFSQRQVSMHNAFAILRAVEARRPILHVVNGGPSFVINKFGEVLQQTKHQEVGAFLTEVSVDEDKQVPDLLLSPRHFIYLSMGLVALGFVFSLRRDITGFSLNLNKASKPTADA